MDWTTKRFLVFAYNEYESQGWNSMVGSYDTEEAALESLNHLAVKYECYEVVDLATGECREIIKWPGTPPGKINPAWEAIGKYANQK